MKSWASILMLSLGLMAGAAHAADPKPATAASAAKGPSACEAQAAEKKLAGAAKTSFLKKCEADAGAGAQDAQAACEKSAADKKTRRRRQDEPCQEVPGRCQGARTCCGGNAGTCTRTFTRTREEVIQRSPSWPAAVTVLVTEAVAVVRTAARTVASTVRAHRSA